MVYLFLRPVREVSGHDNWGEVFLKQYTLQWLFIQYLETRRSMLQGLLVGIWSSKFWFNIKCSVAWNFLTLLIQDFQAAGMLLSPLSQVAIDLTVICLLKRFWFWSIKDEHVDRTISWFYMNPPQISEYRSGWLGQSCWSIIANSTFFKVPGDPVKKRPHPDNQQ